jgi:prophage regulatory protein
MKIANDSIVRPKNVKDVVGVSYTTVWRLERAGLFPKRKRLSAGAVGWLQSDLNAWLESRATA